MRALSEDVMYKRTSNPWLFSLGIKNIILVVLPLLFDLDIQIVQTAWLTTCLILGQWKQCCFLGSAYFRLLKRSLLSQKEEMTFCSSVHLSSTCSLIGLNCTADDQNVLACRNTYSSSLSSATSDAGSGLTSYLYWLLTEYIICFNTEYSFHSN